MSKRALPIVIGIDLGSNNLRAVACVFDDSSKYPIIKATYKKEIEGMEKGNVVDPDEIGKEIEEAVFSLEEEVSGKTIHTFIAVGGSNLNSSQASGFTQVSRGDAEVTELDVENATKDGTRGVTDIRNKTVLHTIPIKYRLDGAEVTGDILGMHGNKLEVKTLFVTYTNQYMKTLKEAISKSRIRITDIVSGPIAESIPLLTKKQRTSGVALVNIGASVTSVLVYENNIPLLVSTISIGGNDITKDIALGLKVTTEEAEDIKCGTSDKPYNKRRVEEIVEARIEDLSSKINRELERIGRKELLPSGIVVCGDVKETPKLDAMLKYELKLPIKIVSNELSKITNEALSDNSFARAYGLTLFAPNDNEKEIFKNLIASFFGRVKRFFIQFLP